MTMQRQWRVALQWHQPAPSAFVDCSPSGTMDLCVTSLLKCSLTWLSSIKDKSFSFQILPLVSDGQDSWRSFLLVKTEIKSALASCCLYLVSYLLGQTLLEFGERHTWVSTSSSTSLFYTEQHPTEYNFWVHYRKTMRILFLLQAGKISWNSRYSQVWSS